MPAFDMSDILLDPDLVELDLVCTRNAQTVGDDGIASITSTTFTSQSIPPFFGVVTAVKGSELDRNADGERITGSILIVTPFRLIDGKTGFTADIVTWDGNQYTVTNVQKYSKYGSGFVEAACELRPLIPAIG